MANVVEEIDGFKNRSGRRTEATGQARPDRRMSQATRGLAVAALFLCLAGAPARADELVTNGSFDLDLAGWQVFTDTNRDVAWSPLDAAGSGSSGSAELSNTHASGGIIVTPLIQCVPVQAAASYRVTGEIKIQGGQARTGQGWLTLAWFPNDDCFGTAPSADVVTKVSTPGSWFSVNTEVTAPAGTVAVALWPGVVKGEPGGTFSVLFDDLSLLPADEAGLDGEWFTDPTYPDFRFRAEIVAGGPQVEARREGDCQEDTVCVSGAVPGRTELFIRILGPRPNGFLWPTLVRFTPSQVRVEIEQLSTGTRKLYTLPAVPAGDDDLSGIQDRTGFLP